MKQIKFISKAFNLNELKKQKLSNFKIPDFYYFSVKDWRTNKKKIIFLIKSNLLNLVCIRSSFLGEDTIKTSYAGKFNSYIKIKNNSKSLSKHINLLIKQYRVHRKKNLNSNQILVQNFVSDNVCSGVMTNFCISDGSPYYTINYDDISKSTESVTSGNKDSHRVLYIHKNNYDKVRNISFKNLILAFKTIEKAYDKIPLDIEFSVNISNEVNILQIRPLSEKIKWIKFNEKRFEKNLELNQRKYNKIKKLTKKHKDLVFSCMSDWNPAEMIGVQPDHLSYSLYKYFITRRAWFIARKQMGYAYGKPSDLMENFFGKPYINLNLSFDSLIPTNINQKIRYKLVSNWLKEIKKKPFLHDKIEFDIALNCFYFGLKKKINTYSNLTYTEKNLLYRKFADHTEVLINNFEKDAINLNKKLKHLETLRTLLQRENMSQKKIKKNIIILSKKLEFLGLVPFSKYARYAFIGKIILISMLKEKIISVKTYNKILSNINTISNNYVNDKKNLKIKKINSTDFNTLYFHLRPGSYDIKSKRYNSKIKTYDMGKKIDIILNVKKNKFLNLISQREFNRVNKILENKMPKIKVDSLIMFVINSMRLRENSKFIFTRTLSDIIELIKKINFNIKIKRENINFPSLISFLKTKNYTRKIVNNNFSHINNRSSKLPYLIQSKNDFFVSSILMTKPNFISDKKIKSKIYYIDQHKTNYNSITGKIVLIENADPGYDWIFSYKIRALITKFGGVNSHMSIRCEEKQLPAVIGVGEELFNNIKKTQILEIDCKSQKINFIS